MKIEIIKSDIFAKISPAHFAYTVSLGKWLPARHLMLINQKLRELSLGKITRLIVNMPPRHGKSELISKYFPAWFLSAYPEKRIILTSYEHTFAASWGRKCRDILKQNTDLTHVSLNPANSAIDNFTLMQGGGMSCAGAGGPITGKGCDLLIIDDPVKNDAEAQSPTYRNKIEDWFYSTAFTRLEPDGAIIIIMTRWHEDDLCGRIISSAKDDWEIIKLEAIAGANCPMGRIKGEPLWKERFSWKKLEQIKRNLGSYWFSSLYQQDPSPAGGGIFKKKDFRYFTEYDSHYEIASSDQKQRILKEHCRIYATLDLAVSTSEKSDFTAACIFAVSNRNDILILEIQRVRIEGAEHAEFVKQIMYKYSPLVIGIEAVQYQLSLIQTLLKQGLPVKKLKADKDKFSRALPMAARIEGGKVYFKKNAHWLDQFEGELVNFPNASHDDQSDAFAYIEQLVFNSSSAMPVSGKKR